MKKNATKMNGLVIAGAVERERERERESYSLIAGKGAGFIELGRISRVFLLLIVIFLGVFVVGVGESFGADGTSQEKTCTKDGICYKYKVDSSNNAINVTIDIDSSTVPTTGNKEIKIPSTLGDCEDCKKNGGGNNGSGYKVTSLGDGNGSIVGELESSTASNSEKNKKIGQWQMNSYSWFSGCDYPIFVIPQSVTKVENNAFHRLLVSSQNIEKLETIGDYAFQAAVIVNYSSGSFDMSNKQKLQLSGVKTIGKKAFCTRDDGDTYGTTSSSSVKELIRFLWINGYTANIQGYKEIEFGESLTTIADDAFCGNRVLEKVTIPQKVTEIGERAFKDCSNIETLTFTGRCENSKCEKSGSSDDNSKLTIKKYAFKGTGITEVEINDKLELKEGVFSSCPKLKKATIKENVTKLADQTFAGSALEEITLPDGLTEIGKEALAGTQISTEKFKTIIEKVTKIGDGAFSSCIKLEGKVEVSEKVTDIGTGVFKDCTKITEGKISKVKSDNKLPASTFENCTSLTSVELPDGITEIGDSAFKNCTALNMEGIKKIVKDGEEGKGGKVTKIGASSFENCTGLKGELKLPESVTELGNNAFEGCTGITGSLEIKKVTNIGEDAFKDCTGINGTIKIGEETTSGEAKSNEEGKITIGKNAFRNCEKAQKVEIKGQVNEIGEYAFYNTAEEQKEVEIESKVTKAGTRIFTEPDEIFIESEEKDLQGEFRWFGNGKPIIHYGDCKHAVQVECYIPGVTITSTIGDGTNEEGKGSNGTKNEEELIDGKQNKIINVPCKSKLTLKINKGDQYTGEITVKLISEGDKSGSALKEKIIYPNKDKSGSEGEDTYTIEKLTRDQKVVVLTKQDGTNLVLKSFISKVNDKTIGYNQRRSPVVKELTTTGIKGFSYNQTKIPLAVKKGDKVTYTVRVYNEGKVDGQVDEISVRLPERLKLVDDSSINKLYDWKLDGQDDSNGDEDEEKPTGNGNSDWQTLEEANKAKGNKSGEGAKQEKIEQNSEEQTNVGSSKETKDAENGQEDGSSSEESEKLTDEKEDSKENEGNGVKVYKTTYLQGKKIEKYEGKGKPEYEDVQIEFEVPNAKENPEYFVIVAEISKGNDNNSVPNNADMADFSSICKNGKQGEAAKAAEEAGEGENNYTVETEDDTDYDTIQVSGSTKLEYELVVKKIDGDSKTLLDGAKIRLYDKDKKVLEEVVTKDGVANFGKFVTSGAVRERAGADSSENNKDIDSDIKDIYYIEEVETPMGYKRTIDGMIKIQVIVNKDNDSEQPVIICDFDGISGDVETESSVDYISINNASDLKKIGTDNSGATAEGGEVQSEDSEGTQKTNKKVNYRLDADIDLSGESVWTPINMEGTFDGNGHTIKNVKLPSVNATEGETRSGEGGNGSGKAETIGFFGTYSGTIKNLTLEVKQGNETSSQSKAQLKSESEESSSTPEKSGLAGLVGYMKEGTIDNCKVTFTIDQSNSKEKQSKNQENIGAIIGATDSKGLVNVRKSTGKLEFKNGSSSSTINNVGAIIGYVGGNAIITECSNEGSSYSSGLNSGIGGFVGYNAENGRVEFEKCTNKIQNIQGKENVGGIIGCAIGSLAIDECSNEGTIGQTATTKSVGGLVGYAEPKGYQPKNIDVQYDKGKITVCLSNKETTDEYKINILKVCKLKGAEDVKKLAGAEFKIYKYKGDDADKDKADKKEESEKNGETNVVSEKDGNTQETTGARQTNENSEGITGASGANGNNKDGKKDEENGEDEEKISSKYQLLATEKTSSEGTITIDNIPMTSMTNDVYYIKEVKAPEGYDILVKDYIRVQLKAKWDGVNERYIIDPEITLSDEISDDEIKKLDCNKGEKDTNTSTNSGTVKWNNLTIANSTNKGDIQGIKQVGGIVGLTKGLAVIENCHNKSNIEKDEDAKEGAAEGTTTEEKGQVKVAAAANVTENKISVPFGDGNVGGIIGDAVPSSKEDLVEVIGCSNEIEITFINADCNVGGIIGSAPVHVEIIGCENKGNINGGNNSSNKVNVGGILGASYSRAKIEDCTVTGNITDGKGTTGGILGSATYTRKGWDNTSPYGFYIENTYLEINNCTVKGSKIGKNGDSGYNVQNNAGGIVGQSEALENIITDCTVENTTIEISNGGSSAYTASRNPRIFLWGRVYGGWK